MNLFFAMVSVKIVPATVSLLTDTCLYPLHPLVEQAPPQALLRRCASHSAPDEGDESEKRQELKSGFPIVQGIRVQVSVLWGGSVFNKPFAGLHCGEQCTGTSSSARFL